MLYSSHHFFGTTDEQSIWQVYAGGRTPLTGGRTEGPLSQAKQGFGSCPCWFGRGHNRLWRSPPPFGGDPRCRSHTIPKQLLDAPDVIGESASQGRGDGNFSPFPLSFGLSPTQFVVWPTQIVRAANQPHSCFQEIEATGSMTASPRQTRQALPERPIQPLDKGGV